MSRARTLLAAAALTLAAVPVAIFAGQGGANAAGASLSGSLSTLVVDAATTKTVTLRAHVVDPAGAGQVIAQWGPDRQASWVGLTLASGTATDGIWTATVPPYLCVTGGLTIALPGFWNVTFIARGLDGITQDASGTASALVIPDAADTTPPIGNIFLGKPGSYSSDPVPVPRGGRIEFNTTLQDWPGCGQVASGTSHVDVTVHPSGQAAPALTVRLHYAFELTDLLDVHWGGSIAIPAGAPTGPWDVTATATDNAGNTGPVTVEGTFAVTS